MSVVAEKECGVFVFESTSRALKGEREIRAAGIACSVIPTPVEFSAGCGISLLLAAVDLEAARRALRGCEGHRLVFPYPRPARGAGASPGGDSA